MIESKKKELRKKNGDGYEPTQQEIIEMAESLEHQLSNFAKCFINGVQADKRQKGMLSDILLKHFNEDFKDYIAPAMLQFYVIRLAFAYMSLAHLMDQWEECVAECGNMYKQILD